MRMFSGCVFAALLAATPAKADEVWKTDLGAIMWEIDYDGGAIFRIDTAKDRSARVYIEGLEPKSAPRGHFDGYWISINDQGTRACFRRNLSAPKARAAGHRAASR